MREHLGAIRVWNDRWQRLQCMWDFPHVMVFHTATVPVQVVVSRFP